MPKRENPQTAFRIVIRYELLTKALKSVLSGIFEGAVQQLWAVSNDRGNIVLYWNAFTGSSSRFYNERILALF